MRASSLPLDSVLSSALKGIVAISTNTLRILALEKLGAVFNQVSFPFEYTPRKFVIHNESAHILLIETEHNAYTEETKQQRRLQMAEEMQEAAGSDEAAVARELAEAFLSEEPNVQVFGAPRAGPGLYYWYNFPSPQARAEFGCAMLGACEIREPRRPAILDCWSSKGIPVKSKD